MAEIIDVDALFPDSDDSDIQMTGFIRAGDQLAPFKAEELEADGFTYTGYKDAPPVIRKKHDPAVIVISSDDDSESESPEPPRKVSITLHHYPGRK